MADLDWKTSIDQVSGLTQAAQDTAAFSFGQGTEGFKDLRVRAGLPDEGDLAGGFVAQWTVDGSPVWLLVSGSGNFRVQSREPSQKG